MRIVKQSASLEFITPNALELIERAGRTCYKSEGAIGEGSAEKFVKMLLSPDKGHESVLEHANATFRLITDRGVLCELTRHRLASFSVESTRYNNYSKDKFGNELTFILPVRYYDSVFVYNDGKFQTHDLYAPIGDRWSEWFGAMNNAQHHYLELLKWGETPQEARDVLPNSLKTEIVVTANFREWRHIIKLRTGAGAHPQIKELMSQVRDILRNEVPIVFDN